jgi:hypothetical protein
VVGSAIQAHDTSTGCDTHRSGEAASSPTAPAPTMAKDATEQGGEHCFTRCNVVVYGVTDNGKKDTWRGCVRKNITPSLFFNDWPTKQ